MHRNKFVQVCLASVFALVMTTTLVGQGSIINADFSAVDAFYQREVSSTIDRFTNEIANDFSQDLPPYLRALLRPIDVTFSTEDLDGAGGVLAQAATIEYATLETRAGNFAVAQSAVVQIDSDDQDALFAAGDFQNVVLHELMHGVGFQGTAWAMNDLVDESRPFAYNGAEGLRAFREESRISTASFIPLEFQGGGGSAGSHLSQFISFFYRNGRAPIMGAFYDPALQMFLYNTEIAMMRDVHLTMTERGFQPDSVPPVVWKDNPFAITAAGSQTSTSANGGFSALTSVPEPSSAALLAFAGMGFLARRRRK